MVATHGHGRCMARGGGCGGCADGGGQPHCEHCGQTNHRSDQCCDKFGRPEWAWITTQNQTTIAFSRPPTLSSSTTPTVSIPQDEYAKFLQFESVNPLPWHHMPLPLS